MIKKSKNLITNLEKNINLQIIKEEAEKFLLTGPTLFGWLLGILKYPMNSPVFRVSFLSGITSFSFLTIYGFVYAVQIFFEFPSDAILNYFFSILSLTYLVVSLIIWFFYRKAEKIPGLQYAQSLLDRLIREGK